jgi:peptide/nickel transport system permease protein
MTALRQAARVFLLLSFVAALAAPWLAPRPYDHQFREALSTSPTRDYPLGTDELGRDRLSRLLQGAQVSLLLAPAAALLSLVLASLAGGVAGFAGGAWDRLIMGAVDLLLSLPWLFLLLALRATLPLNVSPALSVTITFALLGLLGWAGPARVIRASVRDWRSSDFLLHARACGCSWRRIMLRHLLPNLQPVLATQFAVSVPMFVLGEASLGLLGLGVAEPLPSLGSLLRGLESPSAVSANPWILTPAVFLVALMSGFQLAFPSEEVPS